MTRPNANVSPNRFWDMAIRCAFVAWGCGLAGIASGGITVVTVPIGNPNNLSDVTGLGEVNYSYNIGEYDVTAAQYAAFLNAVASDDPYGLYTGLNYSPQEIVRTGSLGSYRYDVIQSFANYPIVNVTFWDAARFANWLDNGQPPGEEGPGTTEKGAYNLSLSSENPPHGLARGSTAEWAVASANEWYKAAFYSPDLNGGQGGYWEYATQSDVFSPVESNAGTLNFAPAGSFPYPSFYGTYDQGGAVLQWTDTIYSGAYRGLLGGGSGSQPSGLSVSFPNDPTNVPYDGFRVVQVPEPSALFVFVMGCRCGQMLRRRSRRNVAFAGGRAFQCHCADLSQAALGREDRAAAGSSLIKSLA
jgi:formylglycine-generating enzyme required for sulfatase activity